ncbi:MAG: porin, partial [Hyphomicrobiaceae bacterium]
MIGGLLKSSSRLALIAAVGLVSGSLAVQAGGFDDLGGDCCADLEERVAELEATTVRKGNTKVSLTISGAFAQNIYWHNSKARDAYRPDKVTLTGSDGNDNDSFIKFSGKAPLTADISVGFVIDMDIDPNGDGPGDRSQIQMDDFYGYVRSKTYGTLKFGRADQALDNVYKFASFGTTMDVLLDDQGVVDWVGHRVAGDNNFDGADDQNGTLRYESAPFAGFQFVASWSNWDESAVNNPKRDTNETWSLALKYAGEFGDIRILAAGGYEETAGQRNRRFDSILGRFVGDEVSAADTQEWVVSAGLQHTPTGLFLSGAYGAEKRKQSVGCGGAFIGGPVNGLGAVSCIENAFGVGRTTFTSGDEQGWGVVGGIEQRWSTLGKTTLYG